MSHILTLICSDIPLSIAHLERLEKFSEERALGLNGKPSWVQQHIAADLPVLNAPTIAQMKELRALFAADRIDIVCSLAARRQKKLLLADMDSTIVTTETLDELAGRAGIKDKIAEITARAMNGELDFHTALRERVGLLKGLSVEALQQTLDETELCDGAAAMIAGLKQQDVKCVLVSGGFTFFTGAVAQQTGFDHHHGNDLHHDGLALTGTVGEPILDKESKLSFLKSYAADLGLDLADTAAIGDGANDLPMLSAAGLGIGYRPKPILEENLLNVLKYADLTAVLYAQGHKPA